MRYEVDPIPTMTLEEFADQHGLVMHVSWFSSAFQSLELRAYARFRGAELMCGGMLYSAFGTGSTPEEAVAEYAGRISMRRLVVDAHLPTRREIDVPLLEVDGVAAVVALEHDRTE